MAHERHLTRWDFWILRVIAVYHILKSLFFFALGYGVLQMVNQDIAQLLTTYVFDPLHFDTDSPGMRSFLEKVSDFTPHFKRFIGHLFYVYGVIFAIEGIGLYLRKRWAEYMVVIIVSTLLIPEVYEIYQRLTWWKIAITAGNLLVIAFLLRQLIVGKPQKSHPEE